MHSTIAILALLHTLIPTATAAPPFGSALSPRYLGLGEHVLRADANLNACGAVIGKSCDANSPGSGPCCSEFGWCGNGEDYCGQGCQVKYGKCDTPTRVRHCGPKHNNATCSDGDCCAKDGECGTGKDFCAVPDNCQSQFGICDSDTMPQGYRMSDGPRLPIGEIKYGELITQCTVPQTIALTFDDGPTENTEELLNILRDANATATFFVSGNTKGRGPIDTTPERAALITRMVNESHQIGSHTWSHPDMDKLDSWARKLDMEKNEIALASILGGYPTYMRPPYIHCSSHECLDDMKTMGYHVISFSQDSGDWQHEGDADLMKSTFDQAIDTAGQNGSMLMIQHDSIHASAIDLTKHALDKIKQKGWKAVTVGECLCDDPKNWYRSRELNQEPNDCVVSADGFCGVVHHFTNKEGCKSSVRQCKADVKRCYSIDGESDKHKHACGIMASWCVQQLLFCGLCEEKLDETRSKHQCHHDDFLASMQDY